MMHKHGQERRRAPMPQTAHQPDGDPLAIGDDSPSFDEPLDGAIGGVRLWSTVRSADELCEGAGELCS